MKKFFAIILVAMLGSFGLVAATTGPATAACPYTSCVNTEVSVTAKSPVVAGSKAKIKVDVSVTNSNAPVTNGRVTIRVERREGGYSKTYIQPYAGSTVKVSTGKLRQTGRYKVQVIYTPVDNSLFNPSTSSTGFSVTVRR